MKFLTSLVIFAVFGWFLSLYGCSVFHKFQTAPPTKQTDGIRKIVSTIPEWSENSSVLILGERHGNPESQKLTVALVKDLVHRGKKVFLGLEIPSSYQDDLERVMSKQKPIFEEFISPIIDHHAYQEMLRELGMLQAKEPLLHIRAIDAPPSVKDRDGTMCRRVLVALDSGEYDSLVVLVGNIHGIKSIVWAPEVSHNPQYLAGRLIQEGVKVFTVMQYWGEKTEQPRLISTTTPQGEVLAMKVMDPVNHGVNMIGEDAADAVVLWPKL